MRKVLSSAIFLLSLHLAAPALAQDRTPQGALAPEEKYYLDCVLGQTLPAQQRLDACTAGINSGLLMGQDLGDLFLTRSQLNDFTMREDEALSDANQAIKLLPMEPDPYFQRALVYENKDNAAAALADLNKALEVDSTFADAYSERGFLQLDRNAFDAALTDFTNAIKNNPKLADPYVGRGAIYLTRGQNSQAKADFEVAIGINKNDVDALYGRGIAEQRLGDRSAGDADIKAAFMLYPDADQLFKVLKIVP